jgi:isoquinoline 1-oxidoreductase alpha subunit
VAGNSLAFRQVSYSALAFDCKSPGIARTETRIPRYRMSYTINVNGKPREVDVAEDTPLLWVLRDELELKGSKFGCGMGLCGACTVHINGNAARSCVTPVSAVKDAKVTTIEAVGETAVGKKVQDAWLALDVMQCGYCQAGQIMSATALLQKTPKPTDKDIDDAMSGNLCRCATYVRIRKAIKQAAGVPLEDAREVKA